jgi:hypothetical protein
MSSTAFGDQLRVEPPIPDALIRPRLDSVDLLQGLVMVIMADRSQTNAVLFFTRWVTHFPAADVRAGFPSSTFLKPFFFNPPPSWGDGLPAVYAIWVAVVLALFPVCRWYAGLKARRRDAWLSYL